jgi:hypothetical protein
MSQPRKTPVVNKSRQIIFRLSENEYLPIHAVAMRASLTPNNLCRMLATRRNHKIIVAPSNRLDPAVIKRLDWIGQRLNELVRNAREIKSVPPEVATLCEEIRAIVMAEVDGRVPE